LSKLKEGGSADKYQLMPGARKWAHKEEAGLDEPHASSCRRFFSDNHKLRTYIELRQDLAAMWDRSNASREQLLAQLQDWCHRAEQSGIRRCRTSPHACAATPESIPTFVIDIR